MNKKELKSTKAAAPVSVTLDEKFLVDNVLEEDSEVIKRMLNFKHILLKFKQILDEALLEVENVKQTDVLLDEDLKNLQRELEQKNSIN